MKVFLLTNAPYPYGMASVARIKCYLRAFLLAGIECEVDVFERQVDVEERINSSDVQKDEDGFNYCYAGGRYNGSKNRFVRFVQKKYDKFKTINRLKQVVKKGDFVIIYFSDVKFGEKVIKTVHKQGGYIIKELNEIPGKGSNSRKSQIIKERTEKYLFPLYDGVICISEALLNYAKNYISNSCKLIKIPILVDFNKFDLEDRQKESEKKYIFHAGSLLEQKDGILGMLESFGMALKGLKKEIHFVLTGVPENSPHRREIESIINYFRLETVVHFTGYIDNNQVRELLSKSSCVIINKYKTVQNEYCFSTKLGEYMAAGKPVVITKVGEAVNWLKDGENAYMVEPQNNVKLAEAIISIFENPNKSREIGQNGKAFCEEHFNCWRYPSIFFNYFKGFSYE